MLAALCTVPAYGQNEEGPKDQIGQSLQYLAKGYPGSLMVLSVVEDACGISRSELDFAIDSELVRARIGRADWLDRGIWLSATLSCVKSDPDSRLQILSFNYDVHFFWLHRGLGVGVFSRPRNEFGAIGYYVNTPEDEMKSGMLRHVRDAVDRALTDYIRANTYNWRD